jgi:cell division protein FtsB
MSTAKDRQRTRARVIWLGIRALFVVIGFELLMAVAGDHGLLALQASRRDLDAMRAQVSTRRAENLALQRQIRRLQDDPAAIEELARRELGLIKPGEIVFTIREIPAQ